MRILQSYIRLKIYHYLIYNLKLFYYFLFQNLSSKKYIRKLGTVTNLSLMTRRSYQTKNLLENYRILGLSNSRFQNMLTNLVLLSLCISGEVNIQLLRPVYIITYTIQWTYRGYTVYRRVKGLHSIQGVQGLHSIQGEQGLHSIQWLQVRGYTVQSIQGVLGATQYTGGIGATQHTGGIGALQYTRGIGATQ